MGAKGDDEIDFIWFIVGNAEVGELASLVVFVDGPEGRKERTDAVWPMKVKRTDGRDIKSGERGQKGRSDLLWCMITWERKNFCVYCGPARDICGAENRFAGARGAGKKGSTRERAEHVMLNLLWRIAPSGIYTCVAMLSEDVQEFLSCFRGALAHDRI